MRHPPADVMSQRLKEDGLDDFIRAEYIEAAIVGLAAHALSSDVQFARAHIHSDRERTRTAATKILAKLGDSSDVPILLGIATLAHGELKSLALSAAINFSAEPNRAALEMAMGTDLDLKNAARRWLLGQDSADVRDYFRSLLHSENEDERLSAVRYLSGKMAERELESLLDDYLKLEVYYYDVVTWLDRVLCAPSLLKDMYTGQLIKLGGWHSLF